MYRQVRFRVLCERDAVLEECEADEAPGSMLSAGKGLTTSGAGGGWAGRVLVRCLRERVVGEVRWLGSGCFDNWDDG